MPTTRAQVWEATVGPKRHSGTENPQVTEWTMFESVDWIVIRNRIGRRQEILCQVPEKAMGDSSGKATTSKP